VITRTERKGCRVSALRKLPGVDKLKNYGEITHEDIIVSAYEGWKANGNNNGYGPMVDVLNFVNDQVVAIRTPRFFRNIPICDYNSFRTNWYNESGALL
jgi:hypothetical protein